MNNVVYLEVTTEGFKTILKEHFEALRVRKVVFVAVQFKGRSQNFGDFTEQYRDYVLYVTARYDDLTIIRHQFVFASVPSMEVNYTGIGKDHPLYEQTKVKAEKLDNKCRELMEKVESDLKENGFKVRRGLLTTKE